MKVSGGIVLYRRGLPGVEILLVHAGGPFYAARDDGAWSIPKGMVEPGEDELTAAWREFGEETGLAVGRETVAVKLPAVRVSAGKWLQAWLVEGDADAGQMRSNWFEWKGRRYPEADRAGWFTLEQAEQKMFRGQAALVEAVRVALVQSGGG